MIKFIISGLLFLSMAHAGCDLSSDRAPKYHRTIDTIGDSLTWLLEGNKLRCLLDEKGIYYDFVGFNLDKYGYRHDGHGGDTSDEVINRMNIIPKSDAYFLLIGVNDISQTAQYSYDNINKIAQSLYEKNSLAIIYISTLLPVTKEWPNYNNRNNEVNKLLREQLNCINCKLIDLGAYFSSLPDWNKMMLDGLHPTLQGYNKITDYLVKEIKNDR